MHGLPVIVNRLRCISKPRDVGIGTSRSVADHDPETVRWPQVRVFPSDRDFPDTGSHVAKVDSFIEEDHNSLPLQPLAALTMVANQLGAPRGSRLQRPLGRTS